MYSQGDQRAARLVERCGERTDMTVIQVWWYQAVENAANRKVDTCQFNGLGTKLQTGRKRGRIDRSRGRWPELVPGRVVYDQYALLA